MRHKPTDVILRARNGDVIAYDETGLILRLSDQVIRDIAGRLGAGAGADAVPQDASVLGDIDAWNVRRDGDWYLFDAPCPATGHTRAFRRPVSGGDVIADAPGPVQAILSLGGPRVSDGYAAPPAFPGHVVAPMDELGAAGGCGTVDTVPEPGFQRLFEMTQGSLLADAVLAQRVAEARAVPLIVARTESDCSSGIGDFLAGPAQASFERVLDALVSSAALLGQRAQVMACVIDFAEEDVVSTPADYETGIRTLIDRVRDLCHRHAMAEPVILLRCDGGARLEQQWALAVHPAGNRVCVPGPRYAFAQDRFQRLTLDGALQQAALDAAALESVREGGQWTCPVPLLAEFGEEPGTIEVTFQSDGPLVIDPADPLGAGTAAGFVLQAESAKIPIVIVSIHAEDPRMVVITYDAQRGYDGLVLSYAAGSPGAVRDDWDGGSAADLRLHRWALPARLTVR